MNDHDSTLEAVAGHVNAIAASGRPPTRQQIEAIVDIARGRVPRGQTETREGWHCPQCGEPAAFMEEHGHIREWQLDAGQPPDRFGRVNAWDRGYSESVPSRNWEFVCHNLHSWTVPDWVRFSWDGSAFIEDGEDGEAPS